MSRFISPNTKIISVLITPSSGNSPGSVIFPTQEDLMNRKIIAIETYCNTDMSYDPLNSLKPVLDVPVFKCAYLTLYTSAVQNQNNFTKFQQPGLFYDKIPFCDLRNVQSDYTGLTPAPSHNREGVFCIRPTELSFNKCKVEFPSSVAMANEMSAVFKFTYLDFGDDGSEWMNAMGYHFGNNKK